jgi:DNA polymerase III subunit delta'
VQSRSHPDLLVVLPEALRESLGWSGDGENDDSSSDKAAKAKPSKEIKVDAVRAVVAFAQTTAARGRGKVVVVHPAERMNVIAANTLLKTLEEPPGDARFVLSCAAPNALLPTIRSRCQALPLVAPPTELALQWLVGKGVDGAEVMLNATGGQPLEVLEWVEQGVDAEQWLRLPALVARGEHAAFTSWPLPRLVNALQKLCHDALCLAVGAPPRYFPAVALGRTAKAAALLDWARSLALAARQSEHPWHADLMTESLIQQGQRALTEHAVLRVKPAV